MPDGKDGVIKQHPRSGKPHHLPDLLAHFRFVAMDSAVAAESLILHKRAFLAAQSGIVKEHLTVRTQLPLLPVRFLMFLSAVQADHFTHHVLFFSPFLFDIFHFFRFLPLYLCLLLPLRRGPNTCQSQTRQSLAGLIAPIIPPPQVYWSGQPESYVSL